MVGSRQSRGIPPTGGIEPLVFIERDQYPRPRRPCFMRTPPGYSCPPRKGHRFSLGLPARNSIWSGRRSLYREYVETSAQNELIRTFHHWCRQRFCELGDITLEGVKNSSKGSGATPAGSLARPHGNPTKEYSLHSSASAQMETRGLLSRVSVRGILTDAYNKITHTQIEAPNSTL